MHVLPSYDLPRSEGGGCCICRATYSASDHFQTLSLKHGVDINPTVSGANIHGFLVGRHLDLFEIFHSQRYAAFNAR